MEYEYPEIPDLNQTYAEWLEQPFSKYLMAYLDDALEIYAEAMISNPLSSLEELANSHRLRGAFKLAESLLEGDLLKHAIDRQQSREEELTKPEETSYGKITH